MTRRVIIPGNKTVETETISTTVENESTCSTSTYASAADFPGTAHSTSTPKTSGKRKSARIGKQANI